MGYIDFEKETLKALDPQIKEKNRQRFNSFLAGGVTGIVLPLVCIFIFHLVFSPKNLTFADFLNQTRYLNVTSPILSLCVIPNLLLFFIYIWTGKLLSARGTVFATLFYAVLVAVIKFLM